MAKERHRRILVAEIKKSLHGRDQVQRGLGGLVVLQEAEVWVGAFREEEHQEQSRRQETPGVIRE